MFVYIFHIYPAVTSVSILIGAKIRQESNSDLKILKFGFGYMTSGGFQGGACRACVLA